MAEAYAYHICQNHPFLDGNKRNALASALVFLELEGFTLMDPNELLYPAMIQIASSSITKKELSALLRKLPNKGR